MKTHRKILRRLLGDSGATFLEYAMLCALVGIVVSIAVASLGKNLKQLFSTISGKVENVNSQMSGNNNN
jgi:Flp pilus assembly pilin Flp